MFSIPLQALRWPVLALVGLLSLTTLAPIAALADTNLDIGGTAIISYANGDNVMLRDAPAYSGTVLAQIPEGTTVDVLDGPISDADGNPWFAIAFQGPDGTTLKGYAVSYFLARQDAAADTTTEDAPESAATLEAAATALETGVGAQTVEAAAVGTAVVSGTNGTGVRCRASAGYDGAVITVLAEGTLLTLTGALVGEWQPVNCGGRSGFVHSDFVDYGPTPDDGGTDGGTDNGGAVSGYATVSGTNGGGLRCRSAASYDASVITVLGEGSQVALRGAVQGEWQPVVCAGTNGFAYASYLSTGGEAPDDGNTDGGSGGGAVTGSAVVSGTNGTGVRCRSAASYDGSVITVLAEGTQVSLRGAQQGEWQPVVCAGSNGFVYASYLSTGGEAPDDGNTDGGNNDGGAAGFATVAGTGGGGLRCRSSADYSGSVIVVLAEGSQVALRGAQQGEWQPVVCSGSNGFVYASYLSTGGTVTPPEPDPTDGGTGGGLAVGSRAVTSASLNVRYQASMTAGVAAIAPAGTVVAITGGLTNGFYGVNWDGLSGYMYGEYLAYTDAPLSERGGSTAPDGDSGGGGNTGGSATGAAIVSFALQYEGYPYVWATAGPASFDCSGFTYWVAKNVLGIDIGRGLFTQIVAGTPVAYADLQPGDLVFFQNTYTWGLSHNGIYIGNNKMIHAENETTGVKISDITSQYYASRWYGAVRLT